MRELRLDRLDRLLCIGAHGDDIEIGGGGTVLRILEERPTVEVCWAIFSVDERRRAEVERSAGLYFGESGRGRVILHEFRDRFLPWEGAAVKEAFDEVREQFQPDLILAPRRDDRHQDHRLVAELTWNTWRDHVILEYEIPKWEGDLGQPNVFVPLSAEACRRKVDHLLAAYASQKGHDWFTEDLFFSLLRLRGMECRSPSGYAEAFHADKLVLHPGA